MENEVTTTSDIAQEVPKTPEGIKGWIESVFIAMSQTAIGQTLFRIVDSSLWVVEKSAQWSLPPQEIEAEDSGKIFGKTKLIRPLPWFLFLPGLLILRVVRFTINIGAYIFGYPRIEPSGMVKIIQRSRRRLRALNLKIVKSVRGSPTNKDKRLTMIEAKKALIRSIRLTLSTLSCLDTSKSSPSPPPMKIRISHTDLEPVATPDEKSTTESVDSPIQHDAKRKFSQLSSDEESTDESDSEMLHAKLERLAMEDSGDDLDFNLAMCSTDINTVSSVSSDEANKDVSFTELKDIRNQANEFLQQITALTTFETVPSSSTKSESTPDGENQGVDSSEYGWQKERNSESKQLIDPDVTSTSEQLPTDSTPLSDEPDDMSSENQKKPATSELLPVQEYSELSSPQESSELRPRQESSELWRAQESYESSSAQESSELWPAQESSELSSAQESSELPSVPESCELAPPPEPCELPPEPESCELPSAQKSCELPPAQESRELPPAQESRELPPAPKFRKVPVALKFYEFSQASASHELPTAPESRELPLPQKFYELPPVPESRELPPAQESRELPPAQECCELPPAQESCELLPTADSSELPLKSCELSPTPVSYELPPTPKSCELPSVPESCELAPPPEPCELPPEPESCELPSAQKSCELKPAPETCTSAEARTINIKEFRTHKPEKLEHHRDTN